MNPIEQAYLMGKQAGLASKLLHKVHAPLHFGAHQAAHKKVHHAIVPHEEHKKTAAPVGAARLITAPIWMPAGMGTRAMREGDYGRGGAFIGAPVGLLGGLIGGALGRFGGAKRALIGAGLGALGGSGLGYAIGKPFED